MATRSKVANVLIKYAKNCERKAKTAKRYETRVEAKGRGEAYRLAVAWIKRIKEV